MWQGCLHFQGTKWRQVISLTKSRAEGLKDAFWGTVLLLHVHFKGPGLNLRYPLAEGSATRTFRVQNEDGLMSLRPFEGFTTHTENEAIQTQLPNLPSDSCPTSGRPNTLLSICWCLHPVPSCLSDYQTIILQGPLLAEAYIIQEKCIIFKFNQKISKTHLNDAITKSKIVLGCGPVFLNHSQIQPPFP